MGQDLKWHMHQLNQYVSIINSNNGSTGPSTVDRINHSSSSLQQHHNNSNAIADRLSSITSSSSFAFLAGSTSSTTTSAVDSFDAEPWNLWFLLLVILYCIVVFGGVFGNTSLIITLYTQSSARLRNPLLVAVCVADLLVTCVAAPITIVSMVMLIHQRWTTPSELACKSTHFLQSVPVAASTISLLMLSLDRYATVKHPRLAQLRQRRFLPSVLATGAWVSAIIVSVPILLAYRVTQQTISPSAVQITNSTTTYAPSIELNTTLSPNHSFNKINARTTTCHPDYGTAELHNAFIAIHTLFVFVLPGIGVLLNHLGVRKKLCALSLTARAAHGELPLPMPILRRPTHMIIVTGMANAAAVRDDDDSSNEDNQEKGECRFMMDSTRMRTTPRTPRSLRYGHNIRAHSKGLERVPPSELPLPQTSTLRSRRRLANMLLAASIVFVFCWSPHVICFLCFEFNATHKCSKTLSEYSLLLGYAHSALNPILYWALNHNSLRQSSFMSRLSTVQRFLRTRLRDHHHQPPASSTNEAALGPFNPRYIKARPQPQYHAPPASSHLLY